MKDKSKSELESVRPTQVTAIEAIEFALEQLYIDDVALIGNEIVSCLTFEELIGALLLARDELCIREG